MNRTNLLVAAGFGLIPLAAVALSLAILAATPSPGGLSLAERAGATFFQMI